MARTVGWRTAVPSGWRRGDVVVGGVGLHGGVGGGVGDGVAPLLPLADGEREGVVEHGGQAVDEGDLGHHGPEQLGREVDDRAHQHAPGRPAPGGEQVGGGETPSHEVAGAVDEVGEGVRLGRQLPVLVPLPAELAPAAHVGDGEDEAPVEQREAQRREGRLDALLVGAVPVEEAGGRGRGRRPRRRPWVGQQVGPVDHRDRHPAAVGGVGPQPVGAVAGRVVAAEHGLALAQGGAPGGQVGVVDGARRDQRGLLEAQAGRAVLGVRALPGDRGVLVGAHQPAAPERVGPEGVVAGAPDRHDAQAQLGVEPLGHHQPALEDVNVVEAGPRAVVEDRPPPFPGRRVRRDGHQPEVERLVVGHEQEPARQLGPPRPGARRRTPPPGAGARPPGPAPRGRRPG